MEQWEMRDLIEIKNDWKKIAQEQEKEIESLTSRFHKQADYILSLEAMNEKLKEDCAYWKMKYRDLLGLNDFE